MAGLRLVLWANLKGCLVAILNDCLELFKRQFGLFLAGFMAC